MSSNYHTPHKYGEITVPKLNERLSDLDTGVSGFAPLTTKGDVTTYSTAAARVGVGTNGYALTADSAQTTGLSYTPGPGCVAILHDQKTSGTAGGGATASTWAYRNVNVEVFDPFGIVAITGASLFKPIAGTFLIEADAPAYICRLHRLKLYNAAALSDVLFGEVAESIVTGTGTQSANLTGVFTANGTDEYGIRHYVETTRAADGFGQAVGDGAVEVYLILKLTMLST